MIVHVEHKTCFELAGHFISNRPESYPYGIRNTTMIRLSENTILDLDKPVNMKFYKEQNCRVREATKEEQHVYKMTRIASKIKDYC